MLARKKAIVVALVTALAVLLLAGAFALLTSTKTIHSSGRIKSVNVGVYSDPDCTQTLSAIAYGDLDPTTSNVTTVYIKNNGNQAMNLTMTTSNWSPSNATDYMGLTWDQEYTLLASGANCTASLTLSVTSAPQGTDFSFDITITGTEQV